MSLHEFEKHDEPLKARVDELKGAVDTLREKSFQDFDVHESGHKRLRNDYRSLEGRVTAVEAGRVADTLHLGRLEEKVDDVLKRPVEASTLRWTTGSLVAIVAVCASIIGGTYASTWGIRSEQSATRSDVRDLATMLQSQANLEQERNKNTMLQVVQLKDTVEALSSHVTSLEGQLRELSGTMKRSK